MDPNVTLKLARTVAYRISSTQKHNQDAQDLAELFLDLDSWFLAGGFLPQSWILTNPLEVENLVV